MNVISDLEFADFLQSSPLYVKKLAVRDYHDDSNNFSNPLDFENKVFKFKCPVENEAQTFRTALMEGVTFGRRVPIGFGMDAPGLSGSSAQPRLPLFFSDSTLRLDLTVYLNGVCQSCKHKIDFLIKAYTDGAYPGQNINLYLKKIGQFPSYDIAPDTIVAKYLTKEDLGNYSKAIANLSIGYGIGAYAYFRRIIENEIKRMIKDICDLDFDGVTTVQNAYKTFELDHQMSSLIDVLNKFLPTSLKELGDNPVRLLYEQTSSGIHEFSDEVCIEKSNQIKVILTYLIKKINEEKYQIRAVKDAMIKLRN